MRFHFHPSVTPAYRNTVLTALVSLAEFYGRAAKKFGMPLHKLEEPSPANWWALMDATVCGMESDGEPVLVVGEMHFG